MTQTIKYQIIEAKEKMEKAKSQCTMEKVNEYLNCSINYASSALKAFEEQL